MLYLHGALHLVKNQEGKARKLAKVGASAAKLAAGAEREPSIAPF